MPSPQQRSWPHRRGREPRPIRPRPSPASVFSCSISTMLCLDSLQTGCDEAGREVSTWCSSTSWPHLQRTQGRRSRARHQPKRASATALPCPSQVQPAASSSARRQTGTSPPPLQAVPSATKLVNHPYQHQASRFAVLFVAASRWKILPVIATRTLRSDRQHWCSSCWR